MVAFSVAPELVRWQELALDREDGANDGGGLDARLARRAARELAWERRALDRYYYEEWLAYWADVVLGGPS